MTVAAIVDTRDMGEPAQLCGAEHAIGRGNAQHVTVQLQVEPVHEAQRPELLLGQLAGQPPLDLPAKAFGPIAQELPFDLVVPIDARVRRMRRGGRCGRGGRAIAEVAALLAEVGADRGTVDAHALEGVSRPGPGISLVDEDFTYIHDRDMRRCGRPNQLRCCDASSKRDAPSIRSTQLSSGPLHTAPPSRTRAAAITFANAVSFELAQKRNRHTISLLSLFVKYCMKNDRNIPEWARSIKKSDGPVYLAIANAIGEEIAAGRLAAGTRLPAQRALAELLGLDFTTVSRAYTEVQRRGLADGRVGQGTYVRQARSVPARAAASEAVDMGMNQPPMFDDANLTARLWGGIAELERSAGQSLLLRYQETTGTGAERAIGAQWLSRRLPAVTADDVMLCPGAQGALQAVTSVLIAPGDAVCAESLTYPGFRSLAAHLRIRLLEVPMDEQGLDPEAFERICPQ